MTETTPSRRRWLMSALGGVTALGLSTPTRAQADPRTMRSWPLTAPSPPGVHDVAPAPDGGVWFTAQRSGHLGWLDPASGRVELVALGPHSSPHGVVQGPDKAAWVTDGGQNAIVRVGWPDRAVKRFPLPPEAAQANLNTAAFDGAGDLWFTGQGGIVGRLALRSGVVTVKPAPKGRGPYGICATPTGEIWWCSLAGSYIARVHPTSGDFIVVEPPTPQQGARRIWSDSHGRLWVSEWLSGQLSMHDPRLRTPARWRAWKLPGEQPRPYAVYVDEHDKVWVSDFGGNAVWRFDPASEQFTRFGFSRESASVRQILGRRGEVWLPESGTDHLSMLPSG